VQLEDPASLTRVLLAALAQIARPSFVVIREQVVHANDAGRARLDAEGPAIRRQILAAIHQGDPRFDVHATHDGVEASEHLVIARRPGDGRRARVEQMASRCHLTPRQAEVLQLVASGRSNGRIATELRISPRTVEAHVTAIFDRVGCQSRAELLATVALLED